MRVNYSWTCCLAALTLFGNPSTTSCQTAAEQRQPKKQSPKSYQIPPNLEADLEKIKNDARDRVRDVAEKFPSGSNEYYKARELYRNLRGDCQWMVTNAAAAIREGAKVDLNDDQFKEHSRNTDAERKAFSEYVATITNKESHALVTTLADVIIKIYTGMRGTSQGSKGNSTPAIDYKDLADKFELHAGWDEWERIVAKSAP